MSRVLTNFTSFQYGIQSALGTDPTAWKLLEPNQLKEFGPLLKKIARRPISKLRSRRKGAVVDLDSKVGIDGDITGASFVDFAEGFMFAEFANKEFYLRSAAGTLPPPAVSGGYTIDSASATLAGKTTYGASAAKTLVYAKGFAITANNGLKPLSGALTATNTTIQVAGNSAETPPTNAEVELAGVRVPSGDLTLTVSGSTGTLVSASFITNWATLGIFPGMYFHIGSDDGTGAVQNAFTANAVYGYARCSSISGGTLNFDKPDSHLVTAAASGTQDIMFGRFLRNRPVTSNATDDRFLERYFQIEAGYPDLGGVGVTEYEYAIDNLVDQMQINIPLTSLATASWSMVGTDTQNPTTSRKSGASTGISPLRVTGISTASDIASITTDLISAVSDVAFKSVTMTIKNNVSAEKALGTLAARFLNEGLFELSISAQLLFTRPEILTAIRNNTTTTMAVILKNSDSAMVLDVPALTWEGGKRSFPLDKTVLIDLTGETFLSPTLGYDLGISLFPSVPTIRS